MGTKDATETRAISDAFTRYWRLFGLTPGAELTEEDGVLWFRSPIRHIPYNAVIRTRIDDGIDAGEVIARICNRYRELELPFMWVVLPLDHPAGYESFLVKAGLDMVEDIYGMSLSRADWRSSPRAEGVSIVFAETESQFDDYERLIRSYWSLPEEELGKIPVFHRYWTGKRNPGDRLVAYVDGRPVGKLFLNLNGLPDAAIHGVAVIPEARRRGIARALTEAAMQRAFDCGATRIVLHSSSMARPLYDRIGFIEYCYMPVYATAPVYETHNR